MPTAGTASAVTGVIAMVLLTMSVLFGVVLSRRPRPHRLHGLPRWLVMIAHRDLSLVAAAFLAIHIVTAVTARYGGVSVASAVVPFAARNDRLLIGLGAVGTDLLAALILTSALRRRLGRRSWRAVHWTAYACWPVALVHSIALSPDRAAGHLRELGFGCVLAVLIAAAWRVAGALRSGTAWR
jgi:methionine sulfoxide reductase heme-binding subunit